MIVSEDKFGNVVLNMRNGAILKLREDPEGDLEVRESTHRMLNIKPMARNTFYVQIEDPTPPQSVVLVNNWEKPKTTPEDYAIGRTPNVTFSGQWTAGPDMSPDSPHPGKPHEDCCK